MTDFNEKPIIALLTDFGKRGQHYVASIKAIILRINPYVRFVDISHQISPYSIVEASYVLKSTYKLFPKGTIFIIVVDPGVGSSREIITIKTNSKYYFVGPNNGIFPNILDKTEISECIHVQNNEYFNKPISNTFHGRDIMAPIGSHISNGVSLKKFGSDFEFSNLIESLLIYNFFPKEKKIRCMIQFIDSFGNGITNIPIVENKIMGANFFLREESIITINLKEIEYEGKITTHFSNVPVNSLLFFVGSTGFLEISINQGNASRELGFKVGDIVTIKF